MLNSALVPRYSHFGVLSIILLFPVIFEPELEISHQHSLGLGGSNLRDDPVGNVQIFPPSAPLALWRISSWCP